MQNQIAAPSDHDLVAAYEGAAGALGGDTDELLAESERRNLDL